MRNLKKSSKVFIFEYETGRYVFVSNITGKVILGDETLLRKIENPFLLNEEEKITDYLIKNCFVVDDSLDENKVLLEHIEKAKNNIPLTFIIYLTYNCNFACFYCFQGSGTKNKSLSKNDLSYIVSFISQKVEESKEKKFTLVFTGGEPFLRFDLMKELIFELEKHGYKNRFRTRVITNGSLINKENGELLSHYNWFSTQITLDGTREYHGKMRPYKNGGNSFDDVINGVNYALKFSKEVVLRINVSPDNENGINNLLVYLKDGGYTKVNNLILGFHPILNYFETVKNKLCDRVYSETTWSKKALKFYDLGHQLGFRNIDLPLSFPRLVYCGATSFKIFHILPDGEIATCWAVGGNMNDFIIGSIYNRENTEYNRNIQRLKNYNPLIQDKCKKCPVFSFCGGGCLAQAKSFNGSINESVCSYISYNPKEHVMEFVKQRMANSKYSHLHF